VTSPDGVVPGWDVTVVVEAVVVDDDVVVEGNLVVVVDGTVGFVTGSQHPSFD